MSLTSKLMRVALGGMTFVLSMAPQGAFARGERVMGSRIEGGQLQKIYLEKMEQLDLQRKQCRKDIETIIHPQLSLMDEMGLAGLPGPTRGLQDEAHLRSDAERLKQLQGELVRIGRLLHQSQNKRDESAAMRHLQAFDQHMRNYRATERRIESKATLVMSRTEKAVSDFVPFAKAILHIKRAEACQGFWEDLRPRLPRGMELALLNNRNRFKTQIAELKKNQSQFALAASRMMERFKPVRAVASEEDFLP